MNRSLLVVVVLLLAVLMVIIGWDSGAGRRPENRLTGENLRKIHIGMTRLEVTNILGDPSQDHFGGSAGSRMADESRYLYWIDGCKEVTVYFNFEGRMTSKTSKGL
jgi:hypothetical protein